MSAISINISSQGKRPSQAYQLLSLDIHKALDRIPDASLIFADGDPASRTFEVTDSDFFAPGKPIQISLRHEDGSEEQTVFDGLVIRNNLQLLGQKLQLIVELRAASVALTGNRNSRLFEDISDSGIFQQLVKEAGLELAESDDSGHKHPQLLQYRASDWDFLLSRAQTLGYNLVADDNSLGLRRPDPAAKAEHRFELGIDELFELELEADALQQNSAIQASVWDLPTQAASEAIKAKAFTLPQNKLQGADTAKALGYPDTYLTSNSALDPDEVQAWADGQLRRNRLQMFKGRLSLRGRADIKPFQWIELAGVSELFNGKALVSAVRQRVDDQGWRTEVQLGLNNPVVAQAHDFSETAAQGMLPPATDLHIGIIDTFEQDPQNEWRIRVQLPLPGKQPLSVWARLSTLHAGEAHGIQFHPESGDEVIVGFINQDPRQAVILGSLFSSAKPPQGDYAEWNENNINKGILTRSGLELRFIDEEKPILQLQTPNGNKIVLDEEQQTLSLSDQHGNQLVMNEEGIKLSSIGTLNVTTDGDISINSPSIDMSE